MKPMDDGEGAYRHTIRPEAFDVKGNTPKQIKVTGLSSNIIRILNIKAVSTKPLGVVSIALFKTSNFARGPLNTVALNSLFLHIPVKDGKSIGFEVEEPTCFYEDLEGMHSIYAEVKTVLDGKMYFELEYEPWYKEKEAVK